MFYSFQWMSLMHLWLTHSFYSFDAIINEIVSFISFSNCSLCVEVQLIFVFWSCILQIWLIFSLAVRVCVDSLEFSIYEIKSSVNRNVFAFCFPIWMPFLSFSCLISGWNLQSHPTFTSFYSGFKVLWEEIQFALFKLCVHPWIP